MLFPTGTQAPEDPSLAVAPGVNPPMCARGRGQCQASGTRSQCVGMGGGGVRLQGPILPADGTHTIHVAHEAKRLSTTELEICAHLRTVAAQGPKTDII